MAINKYGHKILNIKAVSGYSVDNPNGYTQISYDTSTGELFADWHAGNSETTWTDYHDPNIITVAKTREHMTMQQIADAVHAALSNPGR